MTDKKTDQMKKFEKETGRKAIWRGRVTESFKKWEKGEKIYRDDKERLSMILPNDLKYEWLEFNKQTDIPTISKLIRESVGFYIKNYKNLKNIEKFPEIAHGLKEPLTSIKGFSEILMNDKKNEISLDTLLIIKEIYDQSLILEEKITNLDNYAEEGEKAYDLLIVDDDIMTIKLLTRYFEGRGYKCLTTTEGYKSLDYLEKFKPKVILLDIILPDISGYDICKKIKADSNLKNIPTYYISAVTPTEVEKQTIATSADGFFLKPFKMNEFETIINLL
ncbi:MAG: response regulator [Promethearchaeota archaeon]